MTKKRIKPFTMSICDRCGIHLCYYGGEWRTAETTTRFGSTTIEGDIRCKFAYDRLMTVSEMSKKHAPGGDNLKRLGL